MKFDVSTTLKAMDGKDLDRLVDGGKVPFTARHAIVDALLNDDPNEKTTGAEKLSRYRLASKVYNAKDQFSCTTEEAAKIKGQCEKAWGSLIWGQLHDLIEGKGEEAKAA